MSETKAKIEMTLPYPPSVNQMWRYANGSVYTNHPAKQYKKDTRILCLQNKVVPFGKQCNLIFTMRVYRPIQSGDLDNRIKLILDSLNKLAFYDDKQIVEIHAYRFDDKENPRVEVEICESRF